MLNKVVLMGRLVRDPEMRQTQNQTAVANFTLAVDRDRKGSDGERQTDFINCVAWGKTGEFVGKWFTKGMLAIACGSIQTRNWEDKDGNKRTSTEVNCSEVSFGESKKSREANGSGSYHNTSGIQSHSPTPPSFENGFSDVSDDVEDDEVPF